MNFGIADVIAILVITIGPLKAAIVYATLTANADKALRRAIAFRTVMVATIVIVIFVIFGEFILSIFHISLAARLSSPRQLSRMQVNSLALVWISSVPDPHPTTEGNPKS